MLADVFAMPDANYYIFVYSAHSTPRCPKIHSGPIVKGRTWRAPGFYLRADALISRVQDEGALVSWFRV